MARSGSTFLAVTVTSFLVAGVMGCQSDPFSGQSVQKGGLTSAPPFASNKVASSAGVKSSWNQTAPSTSFDPLEGVKDGLEKVGTLLTFTEPVQQAPDPTSLNTKAKPSPRLYVAMARLAEEAQQFQNAEESYQKALQMDPNYLDALLGLGRLKDRQGKLEDALNHYSKAVKSHPGSAPAWNHLGLCYARMGRSRDALQAFEKAVSLAPREARYRHNTATVLVELGDLNTALKHLTAVHDEATANYNLGYLLARKGDNTAAIRYFNRALELRPNFDEARAWQQALVHGKNPSLETFSGRSATDAVSESPQADRPSPGLIPSSPSLNGDRLARRQVKHVSPLPPVEPPAQSTQPDDGSFLWVEPLPPVDANILR